MQAKSCPCWNAWHCDPAAPMLGIAHPPPGMEYSLIHDCTTAQRAMAADLYLSTRFVLHVAQSPCSCTSQLIAHSLLIA